MSAHVAIVAGAVFVNGRFVETARELDRECAAPRGSTAEISVEGLFPGDRIPRADRVTQVGAVALAKAISGLAAMEPESIGVITASVLATAHTNERFERRRLDGRPPEPRAFPYTAPNAACGEFSIAVRARGPSVALVGAHEVGLAAIERGCRWIERGAATRVLVVATECPPPSPALVAPNGIDPIEGSVALVLERVADESDAPRVSAEYVASREGIAVTPLLSVGPLALLWCAVRERAARVDLTAASGAGAAIRVSIG